MLKPLAASLLIGLVSLVQVSGAGAKVICALGPGVASYQASADQRPTGDAMQLVGRVNEAVKRICATNCPGVAVFRNTTAANAMFIAEGDQPKLVYSPQFFATVHESFGDAGIIAIIAHEIGHGLDDAMGAAWIQSSWTAELRADSWAGCALAKGGLSSADMDAALNTLAKYPSPAHPGWALRLPAIRTGYSQCGGDRSKFNAGKNGGKRK